MSRQPRYSLRKHTINKRNAFILNDDLVKLDSEPAEYNVHFEGKILYFDTTRHWQLYNGKGIPLLVVFLFLLTSFINLDNNAKEIRVKLEECQEGQVESLPFASQEAFLTRNNMKPFLQVSQSSVGTRIKCEYISNIVGRRQPMVVPASADTCPSEALESDSESESFDRKEELPPEVEQLICSDDMYSHEPSDYEENDNSSESEFEGNVR